MMLLLNNTVLSNFALIKRIELVPEALGNETVTTPQVIGEFNDGVARGRLPETQLDWLKVITLDTTEENLFQELLARVNVGEAACLAIAARRNGRILKDDAMPANWRHN